MDMDKNVDFNNNMIIKSENNNVIINRIIKLGEYDIPYKINININDLPKGSEDFYLEFLLKTI